MREIAALPSCAQPTATTTQAELLQPNPALGDSICVRMVIFERIQNVASLLCLVTYAPEVALFGIGCILAGKAEKTSR